MHCSMIRHCPSMLLLLALLVKFSMHILSVLVGKSRLTFLCQYTHDFAVAAYVEARNRCLDDQ